jgi:hypothetical protein
MRLLPQQQAALPVRPARPGLVAGRPLHRADRRGPAVRHRDDQEARLQHGPQARQGRAGPLVLLVRQARPARLAGHAQRRPLHRRAAIRTSSAPGIGEAVRDRTQGHDRRLLQPSEHRHVGAVQRGLGPVRHGAHHRPGQEATTRRGWSTAPAAGPTAASATSTTSTATPGPACRRLEENRAAVLGEFGGLGLPLKGHTWQDEKNWGYRSYTIPRN